MTTLPVFEPVPGQARVLGRREEWDARSCAYPVSMVLPALAPLRSYTWSCPVWLDQGQEGACVAFGWAHELAARPVPLPVSYNLAMAYYRRMQQVDGFPDDEPGTSVIAGARTMKEAGYIGEYRWANSLDDVLRTLGYRGPVVLGLGWTEGMFYPDKDGTIRATGPVLGGHCVAATAVDMRNRRVCIHQSWGQSHGVRGNVWLSFDDLADRLADRGEACVPLLRKAGPKIPLL